MLINRKVFDDLDSFRTLENRISALVARRSGGRSARCPSWKRLSCVPPCFQALRANQKIEAIKLYRQATGVEHKEAKEFIEEVQRRAGLS
jgi:hypothetical protein